MNTRTYRVHVTREGGQWLADVPGLPGAHTYARTLPALLRYVREVIVLAEDLDEAEADNIELEMVLNTGDRNTDQRAAAVRKARARARIASTQLVEETAATARALVAAGWSVRDAATALDVAPQRVSQLTAGVAKGGQRGRTASGSSVRHNKTRASPKAS